MTNSEKGKECAHINNYPNTLAIKSADNEIYEHALIKWLEYYYQTEVYDRRVCSGFNEKTQSAIPLNTVEHTDINRNAKRLMNKTVIEIRDREIDEDIWRSARNEAARYTHNKVEELLKIYGVL
ncbi:hypothetical protein [Paenibacillus xylanexedens]|uniref:hypothetical protein n=1 Tax=Paenibacillus xylanexedens TaxID=528191 RepID=UPI00119E21B5|nr:hypothetical protein [Paenibacillus xylanexedens]